ncbi:MAG: asparagine synthase-related protein, partial [Clostridia bacterium]|nr:asparagine synthase-related protein [Clostridia bacterium]
MAQSNDVRPRSLKRIKTAAQAKAYINQQIKEIQEQVGDGKVLLALSGGVDSSVCAALISKAIGKNLTCVHVNHGLLRKGEPEQVCKVFTKSFKTNLVYV